MKFITDCDILIRTDSINLVYLNGRHVIFALNSGHNQDIEFDTEEEAKDYFDGCVISIEEES